MKWWKKLFGQGEQKKSKERQSYQYKPASHYYESGRKLAGLLKFREAEHELREALRLKPNYPEARELLEDVLCKLSNKSKLSIEDEQYSILQLSSPIFKNDPSSPDDEPYVQKAISLLSRPLKEAPLKNSEAIEVIQEGFQVCKSKDRLCEVLGNIYLNEENPVGIGWYMQSCLIGSTSWVPYLLVSYAAKALGLPDIAWRCLNACDVLVAGGKRIDQSESNIKTIIRNSNRQELIDAMMNFEKEMDPYLPLASDVPHDESKRWIYLSQNITGDLSLPPLSYVIKLRNRKTN